MPRGVGADARNRDTHLLFWMSLLPISTALFGVNMRSSSAVPIYGFILFLTGVSFTLLRWAVARRAGERSIEEAAPDRAAQELARRCDLRGLDAARSCLGLCLVRLLRGGADHVLPA